MTVFMGVAFFQALVPIGSFEFSNTMAEFVGLMVSPQVLSMKLYIDVSRAGFRTDARSR